MAPSALIGAVFGSGDLSVHPTLARLTSTASKAIIEAAAFSQPSRAAKFSCVMVNLKSLICSIMARALDATYRMQVFQLVGKNPEVYHQKSSHCVA